MTSEGRGGPIALATLVGAIAGFAFSPIPVFFDAEWLSWLLVPAFAMVGGIVALFYPSLTDSEAGVITKHHEHHR